MSVSKIKVIKLKTFSNPIGDTMKYLSKKSIFFKGFGETYFSEIKKNKTKGWNYHKKYWCILCVPFGQVKFNFRNNLESKSKSITIGKKNYSTIVVPPKTYFSFKSNVKISLVANTINGAHNDNETIKIPLI
jgi:dTDP-4-dehydrorhamnose 3,5-epimerase|tara:strand:- start:593 stop:988 length:396 start_codon:yes stop_codon:yes gene_type:complete